MFVNGALPARTLRNGTRYVLYTRRVMCGRRLSQLQRYRSRQKAILRRNSRCDDFYLSREILSRYSPERWTRTICDFTMTFYLFSMETLTSMVLGALGKTSTEFRSTVNARGRIEDERKRVNSIMNPFENGDAAVHLTLRA